MNNTFNIRMFGSFTLTKGEQTISDQDNHSRKMWCLLAYLICFRNKRISQNELFSALWENSDDTANPSNVFKVLLHRTRTLLNQLEPNLGKQFIQCKNGEYFLNPDIVFTLDISEFEQAIQKAEESESTTDKIRYYKDALSIYKGDFLGKFADETWSISLSTYYHNIYTDTVSELLNLYEQTKQYEEVVSLCRSICSSDNYEEVFYIHYLTNLLRLEQYQEAIRIYETLRETLYSEFGILPSPELQALFRNARQGLLTDLIDISDIPGIMNQNAKEHQALYCDIDIFKQIYQFSSRGLERNGGTYHLILMNITDISDKPLAKRSLSICVDHMKDLLCSLLRCGDIISMCSPSQFVVLLPNANYENTEKVVNRIESIFYQRFPHTPAKINHYIQPVIPPVSS